MTEPLYSDEAIIRSVTYHGKAGHKISLELDPEGWERLKGMETQRCMMVLVPIQNDGQPDPDVTTRAAEKPRKRWDDLTPPQQAGIRCADVEFQQWLSAFDAQEAAEAVRRICGVKSRAEFATDEAAAERWRNLDHDFLARGIG